VLVPDFSDQIMVTLVMQFSRC